MKLYLSSIGIPIPDDLANLLGKPLNSVSVALIPNAKDYYSDRARKFTLDSRLAYMAQFGLDTDVVDLRDYNESEALKQKLTNYDLIWAMGGNTFILRYEMKRSGFDKIIRQLLDQGIVYGGDSAGALVVGLSLASIESADEPAFAEEVIEDGIGLIPFHILPHVDNSEFADVIPTFKNLHEGDDIIELKDSEAVVFDGDSHWIVAAA
jgi:dipeptidase E